MARRGTELFPNLGAHCDHEDCNLLDFLPFTCDGCDGTFCKEHHTYRDHGCAKAADVGRTVVLCPVCGDSFEKPAWKAGQPGLDDAAFLEAAHARSRPCDPARKRKPRCPVPRCKQELTFSNTNQCHACGQKVCLRHRYPSEHACAAAKRAAAACAHDARKNKRGAALAPPPVRIGA